MGNTERFERPLRRGILLLFLLTILQEEATQVEQCGTRGPPRYKLRFEMALFSDNALIVIGGKLLKIFLLKQRTKKFVK
jgi:hypothetical protein